MTEYIGVREAARRIGVHENTIRNWVKSGFLPSTEGPARYSRFDPDDVERIRAQFGARPTGIRFPAQTPQPELERQAVELTSMMNCLQDRFVNLAAQRAQVYMRLQRTGYTTREIGRLVGTSNAAVVQSLKGAQFDAENNR